MRILFVKPPTGDLYKKFAWVTPEYPPLGLAYLAAVLLEKNHDVKIVDMAVDRVNSDDLLAIIGDFKPNVVGLTATTPTIENAYSLIKLIKNHDKKIRILMGGPHVTAMPNEAIEHGADAALKGEAEASIFAALKHNGIFEPTYIENLDKIPFPARHLLPIGKYKYFFARRKPLTNVITSRGCPYNCVFCNKQVSGYKFRARSPENVIAELEHLINDFGIKEVHISDDTFTLDNKRAITICNEIVKRKLDLTFYVHNGVRVDTITEPLLKAMKDAGFYSLPFGIESGSQKILDLSRKSFKLEQVVKAVNLAKKYDFETWGFFIFGLPGDTEETMQQTIEFAKRLDIDVAKFHVLVPFPGSDIYTKLKSENRILVENWSEYCFYDKSVFIHPTCDRLMDDYLKKAYREFYFRPHIVLKTLFNIIKSPKRFFDTIKVIYPILHESI